MSEFTFRSVPAREALADPDKVLFECSLRLAEFRAAKGAALVDRRADSRTVTDYRGGKLTFQHDDGRTSHAALTDGLLAKLAAAPTAREAAARARDAAAQADFRGAPKPKPPAAKPPAAKPPAKPPPAKPHAAQTTRK